MDYTYAQMKKMQEQAFERVREMQKRADHAARQAMEEMNPPQAPQPAAPQGYIKVPDEPKRYSMPVEFPERNIPSPQPTNSGVASFLPMQPSDQESALLVTLMMLLNAENADKELLFALMYVLNG